MMTLGEIIELTRDGGKPDYDDLKYAVCAMDALMAFDSIALTRLAEAEQNNKKRILTCSAVWQHAEQFRRMKNALSKNPKEYIGWNNDPENPEFLKRRESAKKVFSKLAGQ